MRLSSRQSHACKCCTGPSARDRDSEFWRIRISFFLRATTPSLSKSKGSADTERTGLQLLVNVPSSVDVTLQVGTLATRIEVSGQAPVVNTTDATLGIAFGENQVKELPLEGRNVPDLLTLQPGVAYTGNRSDTSSNDSRSGAVNGARSDQGNVTLDGIRVNDEAGKALTSVLPVTLDSVQEFRVTTSNYQRKRRRPSGAQVALVTKSETDNTTVRFTNTIATPTPARTTISISSRN